MKAKYPFLNYAALYWGTYAKQQQQHSDSLTELIRTLVEHESERPPCAIQVLYLEIDQSWDRKFYGRKTIAQKFSGIHAIAYFGLGRNVVNYEVELNDVELNDDSSRTPLSWAAGTGYEAVVRLLVERDGVDINSRDSGNGKTPFIWAAENGCEAVVRLLVVLKRSYNRYVVIHCTSHCTSGKPVFTPHI